MIKHIGLFSTQCVNGTKITLGYLDTIINKIIILSPWGTTWRCSKLLYTTHLCRLYTFCGRERDWNTSYHVAVPKGHWIIFLHQQKDCGGRICPAMDKVPLHICYHQLKPVDYQKIKTSWAFGKWPFSFGFGFCTYI